MTDADKAGAERLRHRWEVPMVWIAVLISVAAVVVAAALPMANEAGWLADLPEEDRTALLDNASLGWLVLAAPLGIFVYRYFAATGIRANGVRVGPQQFPELWAMYVALAERIGVAPLPSFYVVMGQGAVNAFALSCNRRHRYVVMHAEIAFLIHSQPKIVEFVLAHELSHHRLGHVSLWRIVIGIIPNLLVLPGRALIRAQEYSADRLALHHCPGTLDGCSFLGVGPFMAGQVDQEALHQQAIDDDRSLWVRLHNILSDHAVLVKRFKALKDMERDGPGRHGQMF